MIRYDMIWYDMRVNILWSPLQTVEPPHPFGEEGDSTIYQELTALYLVYYHQYLPVTTNYYTKHIYI